MRTFFLLSLIFFSAHLLAQPTQNAIHSPFNFRTDSIKSRYVSFIGDTSAREEKSPYDKALDSQYHLDKNYDFQFRLWKHHPESNFDNAFVFTLKDNKWTARYFDRNNNVKSKIVFTERPVDQTKVKQLWQLLVEHNVLTLPPQKALKNRFVNYKVDTANVQYSNIGKLDVIDGIAYRFELMAPSKQRHYGYNCPQAYLNRFGNVKELYDAVVIIMLIEKFLGQPLEVC